jgi:hypothetical protein
MGAYISPKKSKAAEDTYMKSVRVTVVALAFSLWAQLAVAQKLDGVWKAALALNGQRCTFNLVNTSGQHYSETLQCGSMMTRQSGTYVFSNGTLVRTVADWDPKQRYVTDNGYRGHYEPNTKPPGGSFRVNFTSPNAMVWQDVNFGGTITYRRAQ